MFVYLVAIGSVQKRLLLASAKNVKEVFGFEVKILDVKVRTKRDIKGIEEPIRRIAEEELELMPEVWKGFLEGRYPVA